MRPSADCQTTFFRRFKKIGNILKKVAEWSRESGLRSRNRRPTAKQRLYTFQAIWKFFDKSHGTVTRQWSEFTRPSTVVCRLPNNVHTRFKQFGNFLKKVTERSPDSGRSSRDRRPTVKQRFKTFQAIRKNSEKSHSTVARQWSEFTRPSANCQTTFFWTLQTFWKKLLNGHATEVRDHATVDRLFSISLFALATVVLPDSTNVVSVVLLSFQRYKVVSIRNFECWPVRAL